MRQLGRSGILAGLVALSLAGCSTVTPIEPTVATPGMANAEKALQQSMGDVGREMARIGKIGPEVAASDRRTVVPGELDREVSFQWHGSLDDGVRQLADLVGYSVEVKGASLFTPRVQVAIDPAPRRVYDLFRLLGEQADTRANVRVDPQHHRVEIVYGA